ncbi:MAG: amino acid permease [Candidatus Tokpelaia sp.]|uniref:amino acid permease n=1 Tax=Candidatus Tokpelaia sp. TaxID=2233777 RepID=UPI00123BC394|nr:amino acid permease [Candidatus Tokpelaia sp.]KAA6205804.1 MAG: amino acid permease [Candidatus Tokpelaia sp.]KAA6207653.1 MAG: amino acid permease [Candidatus Tokpelaia sp.]KAA6404827.1 aromatic amino acid transporter AroP [Candidatus Tokpelaia sp.]
MGDKVSDPHRQKIHLKRTLKSRHIQMLGLGGSIGTGLFYGSGEAIAIAGPAVLLSYFIGGVFIYFVMRMMGEMITQEPVAGSLSHFAYRYWGEFAGFFAGWNSWFQYILVGIAELTVIGIYLDHWLPVAHWKTAFTVLFIITCINLITVRFFGEFEFWFAGIKVLAVIGMIIFGALLIITGTGGNQAGLSNLWAHGGFFPLGVGGSIMALAVVMFSFGGAEFIGFTAAEAEKPEITIPKAIKQFMVRILVFYLAAMAVIMILNPWDNVASGSGSPFVTVFDAIGIKSAANIVNLVVITAAISVFNSGAYANGRLLMSLAEQKNAPRLFARLNHYSVPYIGIIFSALCTGLGLGLNYLIPDGAFMRILAIVTTALATCWAMIVLAQLKFRQHYEEARIKGEEKRPLIFKSPFYPYSNYLCLAFLGGLFVLMLLTGFTEGGLLMRAFGLNRPLITLPVPDVSISALIVPLWILALYLGFHIKKRRQQPEL